MAWALRNAEALQSLQSNEDGLSRDAVAARQQHFGPNKLPGKKRAGIVLVFLRQFKNPLIYILLIAGIVSLAIGKLTTHWEKNHDKW